MKFTSASQAAHAIRKGKISAVELLRIARSQFDRYNPQINAFMYDMWEEAAAAARAADDRLAHGDRGGPLHGVPIHVKECLAVAGKARTWGLADSHRQLVASDAACVRKLRAAGAVLIGGTSVPANLDDWQTYNVLIGNTNNPWDLSRTPGGSSGGSAAALAAGIGYLSMGTDIAGSVRVPAHFCGVYGHKPSLNLISMRGHRPPACRSPREYASRLDVVGPMARSAEDLLIATRILGKRRTRGRHDQLQSFRVGFVFDDPRCPVTNPTRHALEAAMRELRAHGLWVQEGWPMGVTLGDMCANFLYLVQAEAAAGLTGDYRCTDWHAQHRLRRQCRAAWHAYFQDVDVFLSPVAFTQAFAHDHSEPMDERVIRTPNGERGYAHELRAWICPANLTGCPAISIPVGVADGLPVGLQVMGAYMEDETVLSFAILLADILGGFQPPPLAD